MRVTGRKQRIHGRRRAFEGRRRRHGRCLILGALLDLAVPVSAAHAQVEPIPSGAVLIADLGSDSWIRREEAQARILDQGLMAAPFLEEASRSENIELAARARYLLARIDPRVTECQVLKVLLGDSPRVVEITTASGLEGESLVTRPASGSPEAPAWTVQFRRVASPLAAGGLTGEAPPSAAVSAELGKEDPGESPGRIEVWIRPSSASTAGGELKREITHPATICLVKRSEECLYRKLGLEIQRRRLAFVTLLRARHGRKSILERAPFPAEAESALTELIAALRFQAREAVGEARSEALEVLDALHAVEASALEAALDDPHSRLAALVGRGSVEDLELAIAEAQASGGLLGRQSDRGTLAARAAVKLLEMGSPRGLEVLLAKLVEADPEELHLVMAALADHASRPELGEAARSRMVATALSEDVLGRAPWEDFETEHFFAAMIRLLLPGHPEDAVIARQALSAIERLARGDLSPTPVRFRVAFGLWRRIARQVPDAALTVDGSADPERDPTPGAEEAETAMVLRLLPLLGSPISLHEAIGILEERLGSSAPSSPRPAPDDGTPAAGDEQGAGSIEKLLAVLVANVQSGEPGMAAASFQALLRLGRLLPVSEHELRPLASALVEACQAAAATGVAPGTTVPGGRALGPADISQAEQILQQWTGVSARTTAGNTAPGAGGPTGPRFDAAPWRAWLGDPQRVETRAAEIVETREANQRAAGGRLIYYEFDLELDEAASRPGGEASPYRVLDGRRLEIESSQPVAYEDRWGNKVRLRIDAEAPVGGRPARYRVNGRPSAFAGLPALNNVLGRELTAAWYETSDAFFGSVPLQRPGMPAYRSFVLLVRAEDEPTPPPATGGVDALWAWVLAQHVLDLPADAPQHHVTAVLQVARILKLQGIGPLLRRLFAKNPTAELARHLQEIGDASGAEFLKAELATGDPRKTLPAALTLTELGFPEGFAALLVERNRNTQAFRNQYYKVLNAIEAYLTHARNRPGLKEEALGFLFSQLSDASFQPQSFNLIQRVVGMDFGYTAARGMDDPEKRRVAIEEAVRTAQDWWAASRPR